MLKNTLLSILLINVFVIIINGNPVGFVNSKRKILSRSNKNRNFFFVKANVFNERACSCMTEVSCSCCETAFMLFHMINRKVCANFMYQRNGLNVDLTIDGNILSSMTVTNYMAFKMCSMIPGSLSSKVCLNILELNIFPRSITACPRLDVMTKTKRWILNYTCISISTVMPDGNMTTPMNSAMIVQSTTNSPASTMNRPPSTMTRPPSTMIRPPSITSRPPSITSRPPSQQTRTPPASNQMTSPLSVNSPTPVTSRPQSTARPSQPATTRMSPASTSRVTAMMTRPATAPMSTMPPGPPPR